MTYYFGSDPRYHAYLMHHGVKGQKWGVRRYQNPDGSLTAAGERKLGLDRAAPTSKRAIQRRLNKHANMIADIDYQRRLKKKKTVRLAKKQAKLEDRVIERGKMTKGQLRKGNRYLNKMSKLTDEYQKLGMAKAMLSADTKVLINHALSSGYNVRDKKVVKSAEEGRHIAAGILGGAIGIAASMNLMDHGYVSSNTYRLSKSKTGTGKLTEHESRYSKAKRKWAEASDNKIARERDRLMEEDRRRKEKYLKSRS